jgi:hypothetical protein
LRPKPPVIKPNTVLLNAVRPVQHLPTGRGGSGAFLCIPNEKMSI